MARQIIILLLIFTSAPVYAGPWEDFEQSFSSFMARLMEFGEEAESQYVHDQLIMLHRDLYLIERNKQYLILMMERPGLLDANVSEVLNDLKEQTENARSRLRGIGDRVARSSSDASRLEHQLSEALNSRKYWLWRIDVNDIQRGNLNQLLEEGRNAVKAVHESRRELEAYLLIWRLENAT